MVSLELLFHMTPLSVNLIELAGQYKLHVDDSQGISVSSTEYYSLWITVGSLAFNWSKPILLSSFN